MPIEIDKGPGGVDAAYGKRTTLPTRNYDVTKVYGDTFREDGDGPVNHIVKEDENGNVGIGSASPIYDLQIGEYGVDADSTLALATTNTGTGTIRFGDGVSGPNANSGRIQYDHSTDNMNFWTNASERMRITSSGSVGIGIANPSYRLEVGTSGVIGLNDSTNANKGTLQMSSGGLEIYTGTGKFIALGTDSTERMRVDASGNLGIGVTPSAWGNSGNLQLGASSTGICLSGGGGYLSNTYYNAGYKFIGTGYGLRYDQNSSAGQHQWHTSNSSGTAGSPITFTQTMTLDTSGNLGVSVTPSAWASGYKAVEFSPGGAVWGNTNGNSNFFSTNLYYDGAWKYKNAFPATYYQQTTGEHRWYTAPLGTANAVATSTQAMTLDVNGNLGIGTGTPVNNGRTLTIRDSGTGVSALYLQNSTSGGSLTDGLSVVFDSAQGGYLWNYENLPLIFGTNNTERMRIDASGNVLVTGSGGLGYGTGSGGAVTQLTSKATAVTLNKPTGQITMNNAALASNAVVTFPLSCSLISASDIVVVSLRSGHATAGTYQVWSEAATAGAVTICVRNISGGSLSEILVLSYSIIKGATS